MTDPGGIDILPVLPDYFDPARGRPLPDGLVGGLVLRIGTPAARGTVEGGGLVIDYLPPGGGDATRVVLAFNELGMWVQCSTRLPDTPTEV